MRAMPATAAAGVTAASLQTAATGRQGRIGPNAITRLAEVLPAHVGDVQTQALFAQAGLAHYLQHPPQAMVDEAEVRCLQGVLRQALGDTASATVLHAAGRRTAAYLLGHRIPRPLQALLRWLPARLAARALLAAITRNAWTFVGSGQFAAQVGAVVVLTIHDNPLCQGLASAQPACHFYAGTFEALFAALVHPASQVREVACEARGDGACRFEISW